MKHRPPSAKLASSSVKVQPRPDLGPATIGRRVLLEGYSARRRSAPKMTSLARSGPAASVEMAVDAMLGVHALTAVSVLFGT